MDPSDLELELASDPWLGWARTVLQLCGAVYAFLAIALGPMMSAGFWLDETVPTGLAVAMTVVFCLMSLVVSGFFAAVLFASASGLATGKKWAWIVGICVGGMFVTSCCAPFGLVILYGLLNERTRKLFA